MHQVLAIINIQLLIQASYYDNQNNRGRDEKKQFQGNEGIDSKRWLMPKIIAGEMKRNNFKEMKESIRNDG